VNFDVNQVATPYYIVDEKLLQKNLERLRDIAERAGCHVLLAQKCFSMFYLYPLMGKYLDGTTASGLFEARLGHEFMGKENHIFSPAYLEKEFDEILNICDHIVFNSFSQWNKYRTKALQSGKEFGIRINPECSTQDHPMYDPCSPGSRMGVTISNFKPELLDGISGLHFHTLCEQNADALIATLVAVEGKFGPYLKQMRWINFGGGHHINRKDYDVEALITAIVAFKKKYDVDVYIEPGEAVAMNSGFLVSTVLDIIDNGQKIAILDTSAACHMPDVLEMPYRPPVSNSGEPGEKGYSYRFGGPTCLAGDIIGEYSFDQPLKVGDKVIFGDMAIYSMVKTNTFNGVNLPSIAVAKADGSVKVIKTFGYEDFKMRLS